MESDAIEVTLQTYFDMLTRHVVASFLKSIHGSLDSLGTGLLVSDADRVFLLSAAHVFDELRKGDICFYAGERTLRNVTGKVLVTSIPAGKTREDDRIDVGVCLLRGEGLPPYPDLNKVALPISALRPFAYPREHKQYLFTGFPASKSRVNPHRRQMETKPYGTRCKSASIEDYSKLGIIPETHIVMRFNHRKVRKGDGNTKLFPNPEGISGSPLWLFFDEVNDNDPTQTAVVGVITEYHKDECLLVAADIAAALWLINQFNE